MRSLFLKLVVGITALSLSPFFVKASDDHDHGHDHGDEKEEHKEAHKDEHDHEHKEEEGESEPEVEGSVIGPNKGIIEKSKQGFKFAPEALQTIAFKTADYKEPLTIPRDALVTVKSEKSVFRLRQGWIQRVPVEILKKDRKTLVIKSKDLAAGDQVLISEVGFVRTAEVFVEGGASHGHSH